MDIDRAQRTQQSTRSEDDKLRLRRLVCALGLVFVVPPVWAQTIARAASDESADTRLALVIGNGAYANAPLRNPVSDATAVANSLTRLGFRVRLRTDLDLSEMLDEMTRFVREGRKDAVRVFFYAGHGVQFRGKNYLLPVDARIDAVEQTPAAAADLQQMIDHLQRAQSGVNVVILDACRTYPLPLAQGPKVRGVPNAVRTNGLAQIAAPAGTLIAFSTSPGAVARDGAAQHSVYARHLLANLEVAGITIEQIFKRVRTAVLRETEQSQLPWESSSLVGDFCFKPGAAGICPAPGPALPIAQPAASKLQSASRSRGSR